MFSGVFKLSLCCAHCAQKETWESSKNDGRQESSGNMNLGSLALLASVSIHTWILRGTGAFCR